MILLAIYLTGLAVAFGYQSAEDSYHPASLFGCPLLWPVVLAIQIMFFIPKWLNRA